MFYNEIFKETKVIRKPNELATERDWRAICQLSTWYIHHLNKNNKKIIILSELQHSKDDTIQVMTMKEYIDTFHRDNILLQNLVQVLADVILEDNEDENKIKIASKNGILQKDTAVSGYTEVYNYYKKKIVFGEKYLFVSKKFSINQ